MDPAKSSIDRCRYGAGRRRRWWRWLVTLIALGLRSRRRRRAAGSASRAAERRRRPPRAKPSALDGAALHGRHRRSGSRRATGAAARSLPVAGSVAARQGRDVGGRGASCGKSIRAATSAGQKDAHANAGLALGDLAQAGGDPVTACEHWQIARSLFRELRAAARARRGRGSHAAQRLPDGLGADGLLARDAGRYCIRTSTCATSPLASVKSRL